MAGRNLKVYLLNSYDTAFPKGLGPAKINSRHYLKCLDFVTKNTKELKTIKVGMNRISKRAKRLGDLNQPIISKSTLCSSVGDPDFTKVVRCFGSISIEAASDKELLILDGKRKIVASSAEPIAGRQGSLGDACLEPLCKIIDGWAYIVTSKTRSLVRYNVKSLKQTSTNLTMETIFEKGVNSFDNHRNRIWVMRGLKTVHYGTRVKQLTAPIADLDLNLSSGHLVCQGSNLCLAIVRYVGNLVLLDWAKGSLVFSLFNRATDEPLDSQVFEDKTICGYSSNLASVQAGRKYQTLVYWDEDSFHCVITHRDKLHFVPSLYKAEQVGGIHKVRGNAKRTKKEMMEKKMRVPDFYRPGGLYVNTRTKSLRVWIKSYYFISYSCGCVMQSECSCYRMAHEEDVYDIDYTAYSFPLNG